MSAIPITNQPNQAFTVTIPQGTKNITLGFNVNWNEIAGYWQMDILDSAGNRLIAALPLITGQSPVRNLLRQFGYMDIGFAGILSIAPNNPHDYPQVGDWGKNFIMAWGP